jgi:hypothetical protein
MKEYFLGIVFFFALGVVNANEIILTKTVLSDGGVSPRTPDQKTATITMSQVLVDKNVDPYAAIASTNLGNGSIWYRLYEGANIFGVDVSNKKYLGEWKLKFPDLMTEKDVASIYDMDMGAGFTEDHEWDTSGYQPNENPILGCYGSNPLRYGDVFGNTRNQLVVNLTYYDLMWDWVIFSPETKSTVFSARLALQDFMSAESTKENTNKTYQYGSSWKQRYGHPGLIAYAKIYIDDFDSNGKKDIVVWRKRYESRMGADSVTGFELKKQLLVHYEPNEGGAFIRKETSEEVINGWLATKNLTWQKGYPSKSECPGQEGQLIPEMHDPLLNDPDVLQ